MGSVKYQPRSSLLHEAFHGDSEKEMEGLELELASDQFQTLQPEERYISDHGRAEIYGMCMLMRSI